MGRGTRQVTEATAARRRSTRADLAILRVALADTVSFVATRKHKRRTEDSIERLIKLKTEATWLVEALDKEGRSEAARLCERMVDPDDEYTADQGRLLREIITFVNAMPVRARLRREALEGRVERVPRLDRYLLADEALNDTRSIQVLTLAYRTEKGNPLRLDEIGIANAPRTQITHVWGNLTLGDLARTYQAGRPLSGMVRYRGSRARWAFVERDFPTGHSGDGLPTRQTFGDLLIIRDPKRKEPGRG